MVNTLYYSFTFSKNQVVYLWLQFFTQSFICFFKRFKTYWWEVTACISCLERFSHLIPADISTIQL